MKKYLDEDFLLTNETAKRLYFECAKDMPIFDYHNHLSARDIAEHRRFADLTELWLEGDHYKWRAMRAAGVDESLITGNAPAFDKFKAWAEVMPGLVGSPLHHWCHLELQRYFGIDEVLTPATAESIWKKTCEMLKGDGFDCVSLLAKINVRVLCTTDDPADSLEWHKKIREDETIPFKVLPSFRPDKYCSGSPDDAVLCEKYGVSDISEALVKALDFFCENGCICADYGAGEFSDNPILRMLAAEYKKRGIVMQLHLGPMRNVSPRIMKCYGRDAGCDSIGASIDPETVAGFLAALQEQDALPKTILYNLNPSDNRMLATLAGDFAPDVLFGAAWWFNDHIRGIRSQISELMENGALASTAGMLTDSRSFTSFVRHEYYRRILCDMIGVQVEEGLYPNDMETLTVLVRNICYSNAERLFVNKQFERK